MLIGAPAMHIPDGFLSPVWCAATYAASASYFAAAYRRLKAGLNPEVMSRITVLAAGIFVAQMLNWPLPGGTSLHFVGGALAAILLGPWAGSLCLGIVVTTQCLVFHDGGITTLGANLLNMAIIDVLVGYAVFKAVAGLGGAGGKRVFLAGFLAGWLGIVAAGLACGVEIGLSPQFPYGVEVTVPVMAGWHAVLGLIEGAVTGLVAQHVLSRREWWRGDRL